MTRLRSSLRIPLVVGLLALGLAAGGCKNRRNKDSGTLSELTPPKGAPAWESRFGVAFDDTYTPTSINLQGRAPNDVTDQQLFQARLGHAAVVLLVKVEQVWGKGRYQGRQDQFLELQIGETLMGTLPKDAPETLLVEVDSIDELPGELKGEIMLLFLRWDRDSDPPYHHHLMPADEELVTLINAMVKHAQAKGVLNAKGEEDKRGGKRKGGKKRKRGKERGKKEAKSGPVEPVDDSQVPVSAGTGGAAAPAGGSLAPDEPPPASGPKPDASTGLQDLGKDPDPDSSSDPAGEEGAGEEGPPSGD